MVHSRGMQVESETPKGTIRASNVETAIFFETPQQLYARIFRDLRPRTPLPTIDVRYRRYANANSSIRLAEGNLVVSIADVLEGAPAPVSEALAYILLSKLFRKPIPAIYQHRYRLWMNRRDVRRSVHLLRQVRGRKLMDDPQGEYYHLEEVFEELNHRHFHGLLARPALGWSRQRSRTRLGHFDPSHNVIVLSRIMDSAAAPRLVVDYVMFHEMLHLLHPEEHAGSRRRIHTRDFREAEKQFPQLREAKKALQELISRR